MGVYKWDSSCRRDIKKIMIKRFDNLKLDIFEKEDKLLKLVRKSLGKDIAYFRILKKSLDARDKKNIKWVYSVLASTENEKEEKKQFLKIKNPPRVAVIGSGPAGLFCALRLIEHGFTPVIIERGECVENRKNTVDSFFKLKTLNENSNVQFGEGGAGTFSDGKLNTQTRDGFNRDVLEIFHRFGAPEEILYLSKPHIGSDILFKVLQNINKFITENGGEYRFNTRFCGFTQDKGQIKTIITEDTLTGEKGELSVDCAVAALGHSARDTFEMLNSNGVAMESREFAVGVRIEHLSEKISFSQYGKNFELLPAADYKLVSHAYERTVFTFCMCPGGVVIPAASENGGVVTNGMSLYARDGKNSNSALMVQLKKSDFGEGLFDGMNFQRSLENKAYIAAGSDYKAPVQRVGDFLNDKISDRFGEVRPTYSAGTAFVPLNEVLPLTVTEALKVSIADMEKKLKGFACADALMTGVETRFSSPVRILRGIDKESLNLKGFYPCGEGSGYSGGITSSAADGIAVAETIYEKFKNH